MFYYSDQIPFDVLRVIVLTGTRTRIRIINGWAVIGTVVNPQTRGPILSLLAAISSGSHNHQLDEEEEQ